MENHKLSDLRLRQEPRVETKHDFSSIAMKAADLPRIQTPQSEDDYGRELAEEDARLDALSDEDDYGREVAEEEARIDALGDDDEDD